MYADIEYSVGMTHEEVVQLLKSKQGELSLRQFASKLKVSPSYLSDIYRGQRQVGRAILRQVGLQKNVVVDVSYSRAQRA